MIDELLILDRLEGDAPSVTSSSPVSESPGAVQDPSPVPVATPSVSVSVSLQPTVPVPPVRTFQVCFPMSLPPPKSDMQEGSPSQEW